MMQYKKLSAITMGLVLLTSGCTKLDEKLNSTLTIDEVSSALGSQGVSLLLSAAYADLAGPFSSQDLIFSLQENTTDESLVPTRGGDWDDNGVWRVLHAHTWNADHGQILNVFNSLNRLNFDATNVLAFSPSAAQAAEARFLRAISLYYLLDLYGQYPIRNPGEDLLQAPEVKAGEAGIDFIIDELTEILPDIPTNNPVTKATPEAVRYLLMKCYLQKGALINRANPTFDPADMQQVITLGNAIINSNKFELGTNYFDAFTPSNGSSKEGIFVYPNTGGVGANHAAVEARWNMTLHYNSYTPNNPNAGWNGFATISDFYSSFNTGNTATSFGPNDTLFDPRLGGRVLSNLTSTQTSGIRPGFLVGQQYNEAGVASKDRNGAPLAYQPAIASNMIETGSNLEVTGIRVVKYVPDYAYYGGPAGNDLMIFRYADVILMVAEAMARTNQTPAALTMINDLRADRGAPALTSLSLVNSANIHDPNTILAERGRELYWEGFRRSDLIRFGVYMQSWQYKQVNDPKNLVFPIPNQALAANPNLTQNPGY